MFVLTVCAPFYANCFGLLKLSFIRFVSFRDVMSGHVILGDVTSGDVILVWCYIGDVI